MACYHRKCLFLGPQKSHFPCFPGGRFLNQSKYVNKNILSLLVLDFRGTPLLCLCLCSFCTNTCHCNSTLLFFIDVRTIVTKNL